MPLVLLTYDLSAEDLKLHQEFKEVLKDDHEYIDSYEFKTIEHYLPENSLIKENTDLKTAYDEVEALCSRIESNKGLKEGTLLKRCFMCEFTKVKSIPGKPL